MNKENYELSAKLLRLANQGAHRAQEQARAAGVAISYSINGKIFYELPNGDITSDYEYPDGVYATQSADS